MNKWVLLFGTVLLGATAISAAATWLSWGVPKAGERTALSLRQDGVSGGGYRHTGFVMHHHSHMGGGFHGGK
jgi:hypothetical protein